jgi:hypothetical protein
MSEKSIVLKKYIEKLNELNEKFLEKIKLLYLFENSNALIVINDDKVF